MSERREIILRQDTIDIVNEIIEVVLLKDQEHKPRYQPTSDGLRLALAHMQDELDSALQNWSVYRLTNNWQPSRNDIIQLAATAIRIVRETKL